MTQPSGWDARAAMTGLPLEPWSGRAWRFHRRVYEATDAAGSRLVTGRYHRATDLFPEADTWPALYLALAPETSLGEVVRHFSPSILPRLNAYRLTEIAVSLHAVLDCRDASKLGLSTEDTLRDYDFTITQTLAAEARAMRAEAILVTSATGLGDNLVIFPDQLQAASTLKVIGSRDPRLSVSR